MFTASQYWQFWRNVEDADVGRFLRLFTELSLDEIAKLEALDGAAINDAKKILATEATAMLHGRDAAEKAAADAQATFEQGLTTALEEVRIDSAEWAQPLPAWKLFALSGLVSSGGEARRLIKGNGAKINDVSVADENQLVAFEGQALKLSSGKKKHVLVVKS